MIISASRRTDIPCHYSEWFMNRIRACYLLTRNPMNNSQLFRVPLTPDAVDCIVFWTKDAKNMLPNLGELDRLGYKYYFQFTLTPYGRELEPGLRDKADILDTFIDLSERIGKNRVVLRYDPIILNGALDAAYHKHHFARICRELSRHTDTVTVSFVDLYKKLKTPLVRPISAEEIADLASFIGKTAKEHGLRPTVCCEAADLTSYGIGRAACIDPARIEEICGRRLGVPADRNQREGCGCRASVDIGAYNTCVSCCVYCYANDSPATTRRRHGSHDPSGELLVGRVADTDRITERKI